MHERRGEASERASDLSGKGERERERSGYDARMIRQQDERRLGGWAGGHFVVLGSAYWNVYLSFCCLVGFAWFDLVWTRRSGVSCGFWPYL